MAIKKAGILVKRCAVGFTESSDQNVKCCCSEVIGFERESCFKAPLLQETLKSKHSDPIRHCQCLHQIL